MLCFDSYENPYSLPRLPVCAKKGMVATSQPMAAQAGITIMQQGGNAVDAAIATAAALTVVEPTSNGIGGDAFALVWAKGGLHGLNASGPSPKGISLEALQERGFTEVPRFGWEPVMVPGVPSAWVALSQRFGRLPLTQTLAPAIAYAHDGVAVTPNLSSGWQRAYEVYAKTLKHPQFESWFQTFAPQGRAPRTGEVWRSEAHARTLRLIAETEGKAFYQGEIAAKIDAFSREFGGYIRAEDLADYRPEWVDPIYIGYRGYDVWEIPPNGQGLSTLLALNIMQGFNPLNRDDARSYHQLIESVKLGMIDGNHHITQYDRMHVGVQDLLSTAYADSRRALIGEEALDPQPGTPQKGGTIYLATADDEGMMVSYIQSNYEGFGSALVVPGTGIALQNRGCNFSLDPHHVNCLAPGKRTFHTIIPGFLTHHGVPVGPFGVMGGFNQPQGHVQVVTNSIDCHLNPQAALDAPRWRWMSGKTLLVEPHFPLHIAQALAQRGHKVQISMDSGLFGRGQIIWRDTETGVLVGGTESRTDGMIAVR